MSSVMIETFPSSIFEMSSTSLTSDSRCIADVWMVFRKSCCSGSICVVESRSTVPRIPFKGVRSSCDMVDRKRDFVRLAISAFSFASRIFFTMLFTWKVGITTSRRPTRRPSPSLLANSSWCV
jgi:hypothetical protein